MALVALRTMVHGRRARQCTKSESSGQQGNDGEAQLKR